MQPIGDCLFCNIHHLQGDLIFSREELIPDKVCLVRVKSRLWEEIVELTTVLKVHPTVLGGWHIKDTKDGLVHHVR